MNRLLLFDIDGTLITSRHRIGHKVTYAAFTELLGIPVPDDHPSSFAGKTDLQIFRELAAEFGADPAAVEEKCAHVSGALERRLARYATPEWIELLPGASELVTALADDGELTLGLLTGNVRPCAYLKLGSHGLDGYFSFGAFGCESADRTLLPPLAVERANALAGRELFHSGNTIVIGDAWGDINCAKAHDMKVLGVATGGMSAADLRAHGADAVLDDFSRTEEVLDILRTM